MAFRRSGKPLSRPHHQPFNKTEAVMHGPRAFARASPLAILIARTEARAGLYAACEFDLHEAIDPLQAYAAESGLVDEIGQDAVQQILAKSFGEVRHELG
jgi:hypothetical protein